MHVAVKPVITSGIALVGASVIAVSPVMPVEAPAPHLRVVDSDVSLTASSVAYVPINMIEQALSAPANMVAALDRLAAALAISGSWNENHPNNQWGWDEANPAMLMELVNVLVPFPALSEPLGRHLNWWAAANLPMHDGCNYDCPDPAGMFAKMFRVPMSEFYDEDGYTFPVVTTPFNGEPTPWSEQQVILDPAEPFVSVWDSWTATPTGIKTTTWWEVVTAVANFSAALQITGHLPDWVAVREIETFFKHFLRPPVEEETPGTGTEAEQLSLVAATTEVEDNAAVDLSPATPTTSLAADPAEETDSDATSLVPAQAPATATAKPDLVETVTSQLKKKFASAASADAETEKVDTEDAADKDAAETEKPDTKDQSETEDAAETKDAADTDAGSTGGKHRKADDAGSDKGADKSGDAA